MSKGWTRCPSTVDRKAFDEAYEKTFHGAHTSSITSGQEINGSTEPRSQVSVPSGDKPTHRKRRSPDGCEIAGVMEIGFGDQRGLA